MAVGQVRPWATAAAGRGFDTLRNAAGAGVPGQMQALVGFAFECADLLVGIEQQHVGRNAEFLPQFIPLSVGEQRIAFVLEDKHRSARRDAVQRGLGEFPKSSRDGLGMPEG
jgi:hypothetical protein